MNEFKRPQKVKIYFSELIFYCLERWRAVIAVMLILAVLLGGYKYIRSSVNASAEEVSDNTAIEEQEDEETSEAEYYESAIAVREEYLEQLKEYIDNSVIMNINAYSVDTARVIYSLEADDTATAGVLTAVYEEFVTGGSLAEIILAEDNSISESDLQYLIGFSSSEIASSGNVYEIIGTASEATAGMVFSDEGQTVVFEIKAAAESAEKSELYAELIQEAVLAYSAEAETLAGEHVLSLILSGCTTEINQTIQSYQTSTLNTYTTAITALQTLRDDLENAEELEEEENSQISTGTYGSAKKNLIMYALLGLLLGFAGSIFVLALIFMMNGRLNSVKNFEEQFGMSVLGNITKIPGKKRAFAFVDKRIRKLREGAFSSMTLKEQTDVTAANIKAAAQAGGSSKIMIAGSADEAVVKPVYTQLITALDGFSLSAYERIAFSAEALADLAECDSVIFIEKLYASHEKLIYEERALAAARGKRILGVVIF